MTHDITPNLKRWGYSDIPLVVELTKDLQFKHGGLNVATTSETELHPCTIKIQDNDLKNVVCQIATILIWPQYV